MFRCIWIQIKVFCLPWRPAVWMWSSEPCTASVSSRSYTLLYSTALAGEEIRHIICHTVSDLQEKNIKKMLPVIGFVTYLTEGVHWFVFSLISVQAVVQSPQVCLLSCELVLTDLYVGVPQTSSVTLFNQTLLPAHFTWSKVRQFTKCVYV